MQFFSWQNSRHRRHTFSASGLFHNLAFESVPSYLLRFFVPGSFVKATQVFQFSRLVRCAFAKVQLRWRFASFTSHFGRHITNKRQHNANFVGSDSQQVARPCGGRYVFRSYMKLTSTIFLLLLSSEAFTSEHEIVGEWILSSSSFTQVDDCLHKVEYFSDGTTKSYNGQLVFNSRYEIESRQDGYILNLKNISHNGKEPCNGPSPEIIANNFLSSLFLRIDGDTMEYHMSLNPEEGLFLVFKRHNKLNQSGTH